MEKRKCIGELENRGLCPECDSPRLILAGHAFSGRIKKQNYRCLNCGRNTLTPNKAEVSKIPMKGEALQPA